VQAFDVRSHASSVVSGGMGKMRRHADHSCATRSSTASAVQKAGDSAANTSAHRVGGLPLQQRQQLRDFITQLAAIDDHVDGALLQ